MSGETLLFLILSLIVLSTTALAAFFIGLRDLWWRRPILLSLPRRYGEVLRLSSNTEMIKSIIHRLHGLGYLSITSNRTEYNTPVLITNKGRAWLISKGFVPALTKAVSKLLLAS